MDADDGRKEHMNMIEAALFVSGKAMSAQELAAALGIASDGYVKRTADQLIEEQQRGNGPLCVVKIGERYSLSVREPYASRVNNLAGQPDISKGALRTLAFISKNEPAMQNSLVKTFGTSVYDYVKELVENDFIRTERSGRTKRIVTTQKFREYFNLASQ